MLHYANNLADLQCDAEWEIFLLEFCDFPLAAFFIVFSSSVSTFGFAAKFQLPTLSHIVPDGLLGDSQALRSLCTSPGFFIRLPVPHSRHTRIPGNIYPKLSLQTSAIIAEESVSISCYSSSSWCAGEGAYYPNELIPGCCS